MNVGEMTNLLAGLPAEIEIIVNDLDEGVDKFIDTRGRDDHGFRVAILENMPGMPNMVHPVGTICLELATSQYPFKKDRAPIKVHVQRIKDLEEGKPFRSLFET